MFVLLQKGGLVRGRDLVGLVQGACVPKVLENIIMFETENTF